MDSTTATAQRVRDALVAAERTTAWLSTKTGIPATTLARKLNGHSDFTIAEIARLAKALNVPAADLLPPEFAVVAA